MRDLIKKGADVNAQGGVYGNALRAASEKDYQEIVRLLLGQGADVNVQGGEYGNALQAASVEGYHKIIKLLQRRGTNTSSSKRCGSSPPSNPVKKLRLSESGNSDQA